jgi:uncharacterized membrane protein
MDQKRMMNQVGAVFGVFMTVFYIAVGLYLILSPTFKSFDNRPVLVIFGGTFIFYGIYRGFRSYEKIKEAFFSGDGEDEESGGRI